MSTSKSEVKSSSTTYILVTGANSGLGFSICCRLIDEFLHTRPISSSLVLIPTTRTQEKAGSTVSRLQRHLDKRWGLVPQAQQRVSIQPELVDLCNLISVRKVVKSIKIKYDRLDAVILNAGIGGWEGIDWIGCVKQFFTEGWGIIKRPSYKISSLGRTARPQLQITTETQAEEEEPPLGEVFCANVFGHYLLACYLMSLLTRRDGEAAIGRVIWVSSLEAYRHTFSLDDMQGIGNPVPYESSKRLTDLLVMTSGLEITEKYTASFFSGSSLMSSKKIGDATAGADSKTRSPLSSTRLRQHAPTRSTSPTMLSQTRRPRMLLAHPGMCVTDIISLPFNLVYAWTALLYIARFLGSYWHTTTPYVGATSMVWLALAKDETLDSLEKDGTVKWGSAVNWLGTERVKKSPVEGWLHEDGATPVKEQDRREFEKTGREVWREMEGLRREWEGRLDDVDF